MPTVTVISSELHWTLTSLTTSSENKKGKMHIHLEVNSYREAWYLFMVKHGRFELLDSHFIFLYLQYYLHNAHFTVDNSSAWVKWAASDGGTTFLLDTSQNAPYVLSELQDMCCFEAKSLSVKGQIPFLNYCSFLWYIILETTVETTVPPQCWLSARFTRKYSTNYQLKIYPKNWSHC